MLKRASDNTPKGTVSSDARSQGSGLTSVDLHEYVRIARRRVPMVLMLGLLGFALATAYALQLIPSYTATATILLDTKGSKILDGQSVVTGIGGNSAEIDSEVELIKSYAVAKRVVEKLKLAEQPADSRTSFSLIRTIRSFIGQFTQREANPTIASEDDAEDLLVRTTQSGVNVGRKGWTYVINVSYTSPNPALAAQIANSFADEYLVEQLESTFEATRRANEWLNSRLTELRNTVRDSERAVELFKAQNNIVDTGGGSSLSEQQLAKLNEQLILSRAETAQAKAKYDQVQAVRKRGGDITAFADALQSGALASLKAKSSEVRRELANLSAKYGTRHPSVVSARAQLSDIERQIGSEASRIVTATSNEYTVARSREASIAASLGELKGDQNSTNQASVALRELEREAEANKALFESFLARFKQTSEQEGLKTTDSRIIERASPPVVPSAPNKRLISLAGLLAGLGLGVVIGFLLEQLDSGFRTNKQVEERYGVPVLASVPRADNELVSSGLGRILHKLNPFGWIAPIFRSGAESDRRMGAAARINMSRMVVEKPFSTFTEAIRSFRMGLKFADIDRPQKVILLTSALPGEGKSTIASNLAQHAANSGERVLLMDLDLRHPVLTSLYAPEATVGSVELLLGETDLKQAIIKDPRSGLHFIPSPRRSNLTHTAELLGSQRLKDLLAHVAEYYDLVIIDTSPLLPVTDGRALIDSVDSLALVVRWEKTAKDAVDTALKQSLGAHEKLVGIVLNDVVANKARYYDYYKSGYYNKKYPYYYGGSK